MKKLGTILGIVVVSILGLFALLVAILMIAGMGAYIVERIESILTLATIVGSLYVIYRAVITNHACKVVTKKSRPKWTALNYFRYSLRPEGGSLGYSSSSKLSNGPLRPERWSLVYSTFSSTPLSISFLACAEGSAE